MHVERLPRIPHEQTSSVARATRQDKLSPRRVTFFRAHGEPAATHQAHKETPPCFHGKQGGVSSSLFDEILQLNAVDRVNDGIDQQIHQRGNYLPDGIADAVKSDRQNRGEVDETSLITIFVPIPFHATFLLKVYLGSVVLPVSVGTFTTLYHTTFTSLHPMHTIYRGTTKRRSDAALPYTISPPLVKNFCAWAAIRDSPDFLVNTTP